MKQPFIISIVALLACGCTSTQKQQLRQQQIIECSKIYYNKGLACYMQEKNEQALAYYDSAIALYPLDADYYTNRGTTKDDLEQHNEAREDYKKAIGLDSVDNTPWVNMGASYATQKQYSKALECFKKAASLCIDEFSYSCVGGMYYELGQYREAVDAFNKHLSGKYQYYFTDQVLYELGDSYAHLGQTDSARICWQKSADMGYADAYAKLDSLKMLGH